MTGKRKFLVIIAAAGLILAAALAFLWTNLDRIVKIRSNAMGRRRREPGCGCAAWSFDLGRARGRSKG